MSCRIPVQMLGQSGCRLGFPGATVYLDPYLSNSVQILDAPDLERQIPVPIAPEKVADADIVLVTHEHIDHCDPHTLPLVAQASPQARFVGPAPVLAKLREWGITKDRLILASEAWHDLASKLRLRAIPAAHPDRAKLALLAAAGRLQTGQDAEARQYIRLAQDWGVSKKLISQILIAGVHNSIGRAAAIGNQPHRALQHFENAITIGTPGSATALVANARANHELDTLGLLPGSQGRLQQYQALADLANPAQPAAPALRLTSEAHAFYIQLGQTHEREPIPFLLIDSKSLPRSGLHYLKKNLSKVFGESFSFCEWYQEPGCCKQMPCALTGFATHAQETSHLRIRLTKSHDFELTDPVYQTNHYLRRLVLVRDPLHILTSWFALDQLKNHKAVLAANGIIINKIWLAHEKEVLNPAYRLLNDHFKPPSLPQLTDWLDKKSQYIAGFTAKWVKPAIEQPESHTQVVRYEDVNRYIETLANEYRPYVSETAAQDIDKAANQAGQQFKKREDPFYAPSENVSNYIRSNSILFTKMADKLAKQETFQKTS